MASPIAGGTGLGLKQYNDKVPPGWRPRAYPFREYRDYLNIWSALTRLEAGQIGPAIPNRLEDGAFRASMPFSVDRVNNPTLAVEIFVGIDAVRLVSRAAWVDQAGTNHLAEEYGAKLLVRHLASIYELDEQDMA